MDKDLVFKRFTEKNDKNLYIKMFLTQGVLICCCRRVEESRLPFAYNRYNH